MGNEDHRILDKPLTTTRVHTLELIHHLTVKIWGLIYFASITKIWYILLKNAKKTTTTTLSSKFNTTLYFGKQEESEHLAWSHVPSLCMRVLMGLTDRRKTAKNLADSRKNWKILTVNRKRKCSLDLLLLMKVLNSLMVTFFISRLVWLRTHVRRSAF